MTSTILALCVLSAAEYQPRFSERHPGGDPAITESHWQDGDLNRDFCIVYREKSGRYKLYEAVFAESKARPALRSISGKSHKTQADALYEFWPYRDRELKAGRQRLYTERELQRMELEQPDSPYGGPVSMLRVQQRVIENQRRSAKETRRQQRMR